jgi:hypothetical protein
VPVLVTPLCGARERRAWPGKTGHARDMTYYRRAFVGKAVTFTLSIFGREYVVREHDPAQLAAALDEALEVLDDGG